MEGVENEQVGARLAKVGIAVRCGLHCAPAAHDKLSGGQGTVRVSPSVFTRREEVETLASRVRFIAAHPKKALSFQGGL